MVFIYLLITYSLRGTKYWKLEEHRQAQVLLFSPPLSLFLQQTERETGDTYVSNWHPLNFHANSTRQIILFHHSWRQKTCYTFPLIFIFARRHQKEPQSSARLKETFEAIPQINSNPNPNPDPPNPRLFYGTFPPRFLFHLKRFSEGE